MLFEVLQVETNSQAPLSLTARRLGQLALVGQCLGYDGAKRAKGRKRHLLVDTIGHFARSPGGMSAAPTEASSCSSASMRRICLIEPELRCS
jgi:hypothetical protein